MNEPLNEVILDNIIFKQYIYEYDGNEAGKLYIHIQEECADIIIEINDEYGGMGYERHLLIQVIKYLHMENSEIQVLRAKTQERDIALQKIFEEAGFQKIGDRYELIVKDSGDYYNEENPPVSDNKNMILFLTNNENSYRLYKWVKLREQVVLFSKKICIEQIRKLNPQLIISYNYDYIINKEVVKYMQGRIVNLHISLLPWNRGCSPNLWSFIDNTPKGVTIHQINEGVDKGDIMYQKEVFFDTSKETFFSTYNKLNETIVKLFIENWEDIKKGTCPLITQEGNGSSHNSKDLKELMEMIPFDWSEKISDFLIRYEKLIANKQRG